MTRHAYYNEIDPYAVAWLRNLIAAGHIAPGVVDERSIEDVRPADLDGFTQCHFFAGIGIWSLALRRAGWSDDRPIWSGSCPCQPFSEAGQGAGFDDERHLWPHFHWLIGQRQPPVVVGEQVAKKRIQPWVDLVCADLEAMDYAFGAVPFPAAGVGAPHIRERVYWVANASGKGLEKRMRHSGQSSCARGRRDAHAGGGPLGGMEHSRQHHDASEAAASGPGQSQVNRPADQPSGSGVLSGAWPGPVNGLWADADWLRCVDDKWRPVEPGTFPLVDAWPHGSRVGCLRAAGNAITLGQAQTFIEAVMEAA